MSPRKVLGVELPHSEDEVTPRDENIRHIIHEEEKRRSHCDSELAKRLTALEGKVSLSTHMQWMVALVVGFCTAWMTYKAATQHDLLTNDAREVAKTTAEKVALDHEKSTAQTSLDSSEKGAEIALRKFVAMQNPPPIAKAPDRVAPRK